MDWENFIILNRVLRVDSFDKLPVLIHYFLIAGVDPIVCCEHQIQEKLFIQLLVTDRKSDLSQQLYSMGAHTLKFARELANNMEQELEKLGTIWIILIKLF